MKPLGPALLLLLAACSGQAPGPRPGPPTPTPETCDAQCQEKVCGRDACGDVRGCGTCPVGSCTENGQCLEQCVSSYGNGLSGGYGRLDGFLHWVIGPGDSGCPDDNNHVNLQIAMGGQFYEVAVNIESTWNLADKRVYHAQHSGPLDGIAWSEGWHPGVTLDYVLSLGVHDSAFTPGTISELVPIFRSFPQDSPVSVYMDAFNASGGDKIHRNNADPDGAIVTTALGSPSYHLFRFSNQSF